MLGLACVQHWYTSFIFFAPVPIFGVLLALSNRRERSRARRIRSDRHASSV
jgi:hypothetical protein